MGSEYTRRNSTILDSRVKPGREQSTIRWKGGRFPLRRSSSPLSVERCPSLISERRHSVQTKTSSTFSRPLTKSQLCDITMTSRSFHLKTGGLKGSLEISGGGE